MAEIDSPRRFSMHRSLVFGSLAIAAALAWPAGASAQQQAFASHQVHMRAGPGQDYPVVAVLQPGAGVVVQGCLPGYTWCDVDAGGALRGWVYAPYLNHPQPGGYVALPNAAMSIGVPILAFTLGAYWSNYYRDRPWYNSPQWNARPPQHHRPPSMRPTPSRPPAMHPTPSRPSRPDVGPPPRPHPQPGGGRPSRPGGSGGGHGGGGGGGHGGHGGPGRH